MSSQILVSQGREPYFHSLPREYYLSADIFELEYARVFSRQWLMVGHACQIPVAGDFFTIEIAGENVVIVRGGTGEVHAHYNVCRHRGSRICDASSGRVKSFVCPYHAWAYALDGHLESAPTIPDGEYIDYAEYGLKPVRVADCGGFIFLHLGGGEPSPIRESFAELSAKLPALDARNLKLVHEVVHDVRANWKLVAENNLECYHCPFCHDALCGAMDVSSFKADIATGARYAVQHRNFIGGSGPGIPVRPGAASLTRSGEFASKRLLRGMSEGDAGFSAGFHVAPVFGAALFYADHLVMQTNFPQSAGHTKQKIQWFVDADAVEGEHYEVRDVIEVLDLTAREDVDIIERNARGASSRSYTPGPLSKAAEPINHLMLSMYLQWMTG
ncbi:MAG TPA: aromatic ring-hydroxylating dioxygenase subunit alpha [Thermoleophilaceae bacterium]